MRKGVPKWWVEGGHGDFREGDIKKTVDKTSTAGYFTLAIFVSQKYRRTDTTSHRDAWSDL